MTHTTSEGWEMRFASLLQDAEISVKEPWIETALWDFVRKEIAAAYERGKKEERQRCLKALPPERIIHDYIPEENTPANRAWNAYREIAIRAITTPPPDNKNV